jgi:hypothetical protein
MPGSEQPYVDYYFRKERLGDDGGERAHGRIVGALPEAKAGGLLSDFSSIVNIHSPIHSRARVRRWRWLGFADKRRAFRALTNRRLTERPCDNGLHGLFGDWGYS